MPMEKPVVRLEVGSWPSDFTLKVIVSYSCFSDWLKEAYGVLMKKTEEGGVRGITQLTTEPRT